MKKLATAVAFAGLALSAPAYAVDWQCNQADLDAMKIDMGKMDSPAVQEEGGKEWDAAVAAMKANNMEECTLRMTNVNKLMGGTNLERRLETAKDKSNNNNNNTDGNNNNNNSNQ